MRLQPEDRGAEGPSAWVAPVAPSSKLAKAAALPEQKDMLAAVAERRVAILTDLDGEDALSTIKRDLVGTYVEQMCVKDYLAGRLLAEGPLTGKGRQRALLSA